MNNKKAVTLSLNFLMGLIFTAFLIFIAFSALNKLFFTPTVGDEIIKTWASDINFYPEDVNFKLLPPDNDDSYFIFFSEGVTEFKAEVTTNGGRSYEDRLFTAKCKGKACICIIERSRQKITSCEVLKDVERIWSVDPAQYSPVPDLPTQLYRVGARSPDYVFIHFDVNYGITSDPNNYRVCSEKYYHVLQPNNPVSLMQIDGTLYIFADDTHLCY